MLYGTRALKRMCHFIIQLLRTGVQIRNRIGKITNSGLKQSKGYPGYLLDNHRFQSVHSLQ